MIHSTQSYRDFVFTIRSEPGEPGFTVDFADFSEIVTSGATVAEAFAHACEALDLYLESLEQIGRPAPFPRHRLDVEVV
jgi:predicted RNase H-like HicB family nuclease